MLISDRKPSPVLHTRWYKVNTNSLVESIREWSRAKARGEAKGTAGEFLAAQAPEILNGRFTGRGSWRAEAKKWLAGAAEHISRTAGVRADAQIHQHMSGIVKRVK